MLWSTQLIHFLDCEGSLASGVVEYGVVTIRGPEIVTVTTRLCRAVGPLASRDVQCHGLAETALAGFAPFAEDFEIFARLRETGPFAAHFSGTENALLKAVWPYPRIARDYARPERLIADWGPWLDTGRLFQELFRGKASARLSSLVAAFGLQVSLDLLAEDFCPKGRRQYHAAPYDALAGVLVLQRMLTEPPLEKATLPWLLQHSQQDPGKRDALRQNTFFFGDS